jgi:hypothetical protein
MQLIEHVGDDAWVGDALLRAKDCLMQDAPTDPAPDCEWCQYRAA